MELQNVLEELYSVIKDRKQNPVEGSYTNYLFKEGLDKILKKVGEESSEVIIASKNNNKEEQICELCDLMYHILVLMANQSITLEDLEQELEKRRQKICNKKQDRKAIEKI
ncbi:phosphoribosyl-ATP diphosphatase [Clostridium sp. WILCCON 0269]|uniref:Phosphoribosyl-ATP pyrophosphatase n=1 Tax=Candidatus Clostridium eludens TaxID=3381663 RepID=A0ABW8SKP4_9CLOT